MQPLTIRHSAEYAAARLCYLALRLIPSGWRSAAGAFVGECFYFLGLRKRTAIRNFESAGIHKSKKDFRHTIRSCYRQYGRTFVELLFLDRMNWRENKDYTLSIPDNFLSSIKDGAILVSAHLGNWEIMGKVLAEKNVRLAVVVRRQENPLVDRWINSIREHAGMTVVYDSDIFKIRRLLDEGYSLALLADQDTGRQSFNVCFFGRNCRTAAGPEILARRLTIPVWICYSLRRPSGHFDFHIEPLKTDITESAGNMTRRFTLRFEDIIRNHPDQWFWPHNRWKI